MSYILDALKKSDQERQQDTPPHLHSNHGYPPSFNDSGRRSQWLVIGAIAAVSLLLGGGTMYFFNQVQQPVQQQKSEAPSPPTAPTPRPAVQRPETIPEQVARVVEIPPETTEKAPEAIETVPLLVKIPREKSKILFTPYADTEVEQEYTLAKPPEPPSPLPLLKDMPASLRTQIPKFSFAGHTYSQDPAQRMIIINNTIAREGDRIDLNTRLKEITWEGVIIDFKGISFRVEAF